MKAAVLHGPRDVRVEDVPDAPAPAEGEVRLRILAAGLCGTDSHEYAHAPVLSPLQTRNNRSGHLGPIVIGHEFLGLVDSIGVGVTGFTEGTRVVAGAGVWCGNCEPCREGRTNLCTSYYTFGLQADGGMAEYLTVPARMCVAVPNDCSDADAVLAQPVAVAMHAVQRSAVGKDDHVAVIGVGAIGSLLVASLRSVGALVTAFDVDQHRLDTAHALGAEHQVLIRVGGEPAPEFLASFDAVFDTSGSEGGLATAQSLTKRGGRIVAVGLPTHQIQFDARSAIIDEIDVITSSAHVCLVNLPAAVALLTQRSIHELIVERTVDLDEIVNLGLEPLANGELKGKVIVRVAD